MSPNSALVVTEVGNDENVLSLVVENGDSLDGVQEMLRRFQEDHIQYQEFVDLVQLAEYPGLSYSTPVAHPIPNEPTSPEATIDESRIDTICTLLEVSRSTAVRLIGSVGGPNSSETPIVSLVDDCLEWHYRQRLARIEAVSELMRIKNREVLKGVDEITVNSAGAPRGLFRLLLSALCSASPKPRVSRALARTNLLRNKLPTELNDVSWDKLMMDVSTSRKLWSEHEASSTLRAIFFLLDAHMEADRCDVALLLIAFQQIEPRGPITPLVLVPAFALWRILPEVDENREPLLLSHPLLMDDTPEHAHLLLLVEKIRNTKDQQLSLLCIGLIMQATAAPGLKKKGLEIANDANTHFDAFGTLYATMETLVYHHQNSFHPSFDDLIPYDCRDFLDRKNYEFEDLEDELSPVSLGFATLGRDILAGSIHVFGNQLLPKLKLPQPDNVSRLASLFGVIFRNSKFLILDFRSEWEEQGDSPLCRLLDSSFRLAQAALEATKTGFRNRDEVLLCLTTYLQMITSITYDPDTVEGLFETMLLDGLVRTCIDLAKHPGSDIAKSCRAKIISSISTLTSLGRRDEHCRDMLRGMLEESVDSSIISGPVALAELIPLSTEETIPLVFSCLADLVESASPQWLLGAVKAIYLVQKDEHIWRGLFENGDAGSLLRLLNGLMVQLPTLILSATDPAVGEQVLDVMKLGVRTACNFLTAYSPKKTDFDTPRHIMDTIEAALQQLRAIMELHKSERIQSKSQEFLHEILWNLGTALGDVIVVYAVFPCISAISTQLEAIIENRENGSSAIKWRSLEDALLRQLQELNRLDLPVALAKQTGKQQLSSCWTAVSAIRLLSRWMKALESKAVSAFALEGSLSVHPDSLSRTLELGPLRNLLHPIACPSEIHSKLHSFWASLQVTPLSLLPGLVRIGHRDVCMVMANNTLDLLALLLSACSADQQASSGFFHALNLFSCFNECNEEIYKSVDALSSTRSISEENMLDISTITRFLRLVGGFLDSKALSPTQVLKSSFSSAVQGFVSVLRSVLPAISDDDVSLDEGEIVFKLRLASGCAFCLASIWSHDSGSSNSTENSLGTLVENKQSFFEILLGSIIYGAPKRLNGATQNDVHGLCVLFALYPFIRKYIPCREAAFTQLMFYFSPTFDD